MVKIEGCTPDELFSLPAEELDQLIFIGRPLVVRIGSAKILAEFHQRHPDLIIDVAHIDGGGEGVLPVLVQVAERFARSRGFHRIEWLVRATNCAHPNEKLRRVLVRRGFQVRQHPEFGECYFSATAVGVDDVGEYS